MDMDAFYASIEQRDHPEYRGKPVMVGSPPDKRGIIATCSYEARKFGVHSAMPSRTAGKLCPKGIFVRPDMKKYAAESKLIMAILGDFSPKVEPVSIDEAFLDVSTVEHLLGDALTIARRIKERIRRERGLTASIGVAPNKFLAKLASDLEKPDGLAVITTENAHAILAPLPVGKLWGVGDVTRKLLESHGLKTIGNIQGAGAATLRSLLGNQADHLHRLSLGMDERDVETESEAKSIGSEHTFDVDTSNEKLLRETLLTQADEIASDLRSENTAARTITLKLRYEDFTTITRRITLDTPTQDDVTIYDRALALLHAEKIGERKIRLIGISSSGFTPPAAQMDLFDQSGEKKQRLAKAVDAIRAKHGSRAIGRVVG